MTSANGSAEGSSASGGVRATRKNRRALIIGSTGSIAILVGALVLEAEHSWILKLPTQWLAVAGLPVLIGLVLGGYIGRFSFAGVEVEARPLKPVEYVKPGGEPQGRKDATLCVKTARARARRSTSAATDWLWCIFINRQCVEIRSMIYPST